MFSYFCSKHGYTICVLEQQRKSISMCEEALNFQKKSFKSYFTFRLPYFEYAGGVISFTPEQFQAINGFSNVFFGWGGEDDDLRRRFVRITKNCPCNKQRYFEL